MYVMNNSNGIYPPTQEYLDVIKQGYIDFKLPLKPPRAAVEASWRPVGRMNERGVAFLKGRRELGM
jgi:hypothetical protein